MVKLKCIVIMRGFLGSYVLSCFKLPLLCTYNKDLQKDYIHQIFESFCILYRCKEDRDVLLLYNACMSTFGLAFKLQ